MIIRLLCKIVMHTFFSRVRVHHGERIPSEGPLLLVSNHHSSLVDPVALLATMPRRPQFLAKAALWETKYLMLRPFLWLSRTIPVYRHVDGGGDNTSMFAASYEVLKNDGTIALFVEGMSHDMPGLLALKTGAARLALGADTTVAVVPIGLIYDDRARFRSRTMIYVGEPIMVTGAIGGDDDREQVRELTAEIAEALDDVAPSWETWEEHNAALMAARLTVADSPKRTMGEVITQLNRAVDDRTAEGQAVIQTMRSLESESARLGLDIETVVDRPRDRVGQLNRWTIVETGLFVVPTILGRVLNLPPHALINQLAARQDLNFRATFKIISAIVLYPLWWLLVAAVMTATLGPIVGAVALVALPLLGYLAARTYGRLRRFRNRRNVRSSAGGAEHESLLIALRHDVLNATDAVLAA